MRVSKPTQHQWRAFHAAAWPLLWGIETSDPAAYEAGLEIIVAPCMPEHAAKTLAEAYNSVCLIPSVSRPQSGSET